MAIKTSQYDTFVYMSYIRENRTDLARFRDEVDLVVGNYDGRRDFVVDVSRCDSLISAELGTVAKLVTAVEKSGRYVRIIASGQARRTLEDSTLSNRDSVILYEKLQDLVEEMKNAGGQPPQPPAVGRDCSVVALEGSLTGIKVNEMVASVQAALRGKHARVVLEFTKVSYIDSLCIGQLMYLDGVAKGLGKSLVIVCPPGDVVDVLMDASLDKLFDIVAPSS